MKTMKNTMRSTVFVLFALLSLLWVSCGDDGGQDDPTPDPLTVLSVKANNQNLTDGAANIATDVQIEMIFSHSLDTEVFESVLSYESEAGEAVDYDISYSASNSTVSIAAASALDYLATYTLTVSAGELGANGESLSTPYSVSFSTVDATLFSGGDGTEGDPYRIKDAGDLALINSYLNAHFIQIADIDLTGSGGEAGWVPIGSAEFPFAGHYNGGGFAISNLEITNAVEDMVNFVGLFGVVEGGVIEQVAVSSTGIGVTGTQGSGLLIGQLRSGSVTRCSSAGNVFGDTRTGGLIGDMESGTVYQCSSSATVSPERSRAGGLIGIVAEPDREEVTDTESLISESFATGAVTSGSARVGGLIGSLGLNGVVENSYATGSVTGPNRSASLFGRLDGKVSNAYGTGSVTVTEEDNSSDYPGYVVGELEDTAEITDVFYDSNLSLTYSGGSPITDVGIAVEIAGMDCGDPNSILSGFDFTSVWTCEAGAWPTLTWENE